MQRVYFWQFPKRGDTAHLSYQVSAKEVGEQLMNLEICVTGPYLR